MIQYSPITPEIRSRIVHELGEDCIVDDAEAKKVYDRDASELRFSPELVVRVQDSDQVSRLLKLANQYRFR